MASNAFGVNTELIFHEFLQLLLPSPFMCLLPTLLPGLLPLPPSVSPCHQLNTTASIKFSLLALWQKLLAWTSHHIDFRGSSGMWICYPVQAHLKKVKTQTQTPSLLPPWVASSSGCALWFGYLRYMLTISQGQHVFQDGYWSAHYRLQLLLASILSNQLPLCSALSHYQPAFDVSEAGEDICPL